MSKPVSFLHHPDGCVIVGAYKATLEEFAQDLHALALPAYEGLPEGAVARRYLGGGRHFLLDADGNQLAGEPDVWPLGAKVIGKEAALVQLQLEREAAAQLADQAEDQEIVAP